MADASPRRPNLLYIHSDQHNPAIMGCSGDNLVRTPNLDGLAARGVRFESVYCPSPLCVPSRMATLTGRYPYENRVWTNDHILDSAIPTLAHAMGAAGYTPILIGRMHAVGTDQLHGYAERLVGDHGPNYPGGRPVDHGELHGTAGPARISLRKSGPGQSAYQVHDEYVAAATVDYLNRLGIAKRSGQSPEPFSLSVGFMLPHQPFVARREDYDLYRDAVGLPRHPPTASDLQHPHFQSWRRATGIEEVSTEEVLRARAAYYGLVTALDRLIGQILDSLRANSLEEDTLVLYTSDHGEQLGEHGLWWKQTFYEDSARVPAILAWPGRVSPGTRCARVVSALDLNATLLDALGAPPLPSSHGRSLVPLLANPDRAWDDTAVCEYCTDEGAYQRMIRRGPWKLNYYHGQEPQLFNIAEDPHELRDLAADPGHRRVRAELTDEVLRGWDPPAVAADMALRRSEAAILRAWTAAVRPPDQYRWPLLPEMDYLDEHEAQ
jgi:choline-sulfatase